MAEIINTINTLNTLNYYSLSKTNYPKTPGLKMIGDVSVFKMQLTLQSWVCFIKHPTTKRAVPLLPPTAPDGAFQSRAVSERLPVPKQASPSGCAHYDTLL